MSFRRILPIPVILAALVLPTACGQGQGEAGGAEEPQATGQGDVAPDFADMTVEQLQEVMNTRDPFLVNVHIPFEGDLPGTDTSIRFDEIAQHLEELPGDKDAEIILYCRSGRMSAEAAGVLASLGYTKVSNLVGGFRAWEEAGLEVIRSP